MIRCSDDGDMFTAYMVYSGIKHLFANTNTLCSKDTWLNRYFLLLSIYYLQLSYFFVRRYVAQ